MQDKFNATALMISCQNGHVETAELLIHRGAVVNYQRNVRLHLHHIINWEIDERFKFGNVVVCNGNLKFANLSLLLYYYV